MNNINLKGPSELSVYSGQRSNQVYLVLDYDNPKIFGDVIDLKIDFKYYPKHDQDFCILDATYDVSIAEIEHQITSVDTFNPTAEEYLFDSFVSYHCGIGRIFEKPDKTTTLVQDMHCQWTGAWFPTDQVYPCVCKSYSTLYRSVIH